MSALHLTRHAEARLRQRGMRADDLDLIVAHGTLVGDDTYVLRAEDAAREIEDCKDRIRHLERLRGRKVVVDGTAVLTCYRVHPQGWKRLRAAGRERIAG